MMCSNVLSRGLRRDDLFILDGFLFGAVKTP
jgi:hypothetical protein